MVLILFGRDQSLVCLDQSALVCRASLNFDWFSKLEPDVGEVSILLITVWESNDKVELKKWGVFPKEGADEERDSELNEDYDFQLGSLERSSVVVLGGLVAFRPVPSVGEWVFCLLLLRDSSAGVCDGSEMGVCCFEPMGCLNCSGSEVAGGSSFLDEEEVEECNKQDEGCERVEHESRGKDQALSFCQQLIQLWLRSRLKQQCLLSEGT